MKKQHLALVTILLLALGWTWARQRSRHFIGHHDWDNVFWVAAAENYQRYGLIDTRLQQITTPYPAAESAWNVNQHHPPGISLLTFASISLFGHSEWAARLGPLAASALAAALLFKLVRRHFAIETALLSLFFWGFTPVVIYYSAKIGHEQFTLPLMLLTLILYPHCTGWRQSLLLVTALAGSFISWAWYLFVGLLFLYTVCTEKRNGLRRLAALWLGTALAGVGLILLGIWQQPGFFHDLYDAFTLRATNTAGDSISLQLWLFTVGASLLWLPTPVVTFLALVPIRQSLHSGFSRIGVLLAIPAAVAIIYCLVFWQATYIHDYLPYYLFASMATGAAVGFWHLVYAYGRPPRLLWRLLLGLLWVAFIIGSWRWARSLYTVDTNVQRYEWGIAARTATTPAEIVVTNLPDFGPHVSYYARRAILFERDPDEVLSATRPPIWGFYIYCVKEPETLPAWIRSYRFEFDSASLCYLIDLNS